MARTDGWWYWCVFGWTGGGSSGRIEEGAIGSVLITHGLYQSGSSFMLNLNSEKNESCEILNKTAISFDNLSFSLGKPTPAKCALKEILTTAN